MSKKLFLIFLYMLLVMMSGCSEYEQPSIINRYAEAHLNNKNELQFRFQINDKIFTDEKMYKVKVLIHDDELAAALGREEIIYGSKEVFNGKTLNVSEEKKSFIYMEPIPLLLDFHVSELKEMIQDQNAVSVEIISEEEVIAKSYLTNFTSQI